MIPPEEIRILVVEDDLYFQRVLLKRISSEGYRVFAAGDGREGMKAIVTLDPHLVISDWMMPHVDGLELCQSVKTGLLDAAPYFILLTAKGEISDRLLGLETGADDYLVKPCDQGEIMARIRSGLRTVVLARELRDTVNRLKVVNAELSQARDAARRLAAVPACSCCGKVRTPEGAWVELEHHAAAQGLIRPGLATCPECEAGRPADAADRALTEP